MASLSDEISESSKKLAQKLKGIDQELIDNEIFINVPGCESNFILGPCFKTTLPSEISRFYPLAEGERLFNRSLEPDRYIDKTTRSWPSPNRIWVDWVNRVEKEKGMFWKSAGIYDAIQLSKIDIPLDKNLLYAALFFWSVSTNSFHFKFGMIGPTVLDIVALTGLSPHGDLVCASLNNLESSVKTFDSFNYCKYMDVSMGAVEVSEEEHVCFLVMWLSKYLFCNCSPNMMREYTKMAFALSEGQKLALAPLVLASVYHVCEDIIMNKFEGGGGPLWVLQFWIQSYFPEYGPLTVNMVNAPTFGYPLANGVLRPKNFNQCFSFFLTCSSRTPTQFTPFFSGTCIPEWLKKLLGPDIDEFNDVWASFVLPRDLHYSLSFDGSSGCKCRLEHYSPNQFARQFGMTQGVPLPVLGQVKGTFSFVSFKVAPNVTESFESWWSSYIRSTQTSSSPVKVVNKAPPPTIVNLSSNAMRARYDQSSSECARNKKMKCDGFGGNSINAQKTSHCKAERPTYKKRNAPSLKKISKQYTRQEPSLGKSAVISLPATVCSSKPSSATKDRNKTTKEKPVLDDYTPVKMTQQKPVLDDDTPSPASSFTSEEEQEQGFDETMKSDNVDNVEELFAKVGAQIKKSQFLSSATYNYDNEQFTPALSPPSVEKLERAKEDIMRFLRMPFRDVLSGDNYSVLNSSLSTYTASSGLPIETRSALYKLASSLPELCSKFRRAKKCEEEFYTKSAKKALLIDDLKRAQELYSDLKDDQDKFDSEMDSIKNQILELKSKWKEAKMKKKEVQARKLSLAKDCFTKSSALDEMEIELPAMERKKELAESDIARVEANWAGFKHKLVN